MKENELLNASLYGYRNTSLFERFLELARGRPALEKVVRDMPLGSGPGRSAHDKAIKSRRTKRRAFRDTCAQQRYSRNDLNREA
jgi:hypothetical protein